MTAPHSKSLQMLLWRGISCGGMLGPGSQEKFRSVEDAVEECPMGDRGCGGERVQGGVEDGRSGPGRRGEARR